MLSTDPHQWKYAPPCRPTVRPLFASLILLVFTCAPLESFTPCTLPLSSSNVHVWSSNDGNDGSPNDTAPSTREALAEEKKIRSAYFLQSSGFAPSKSTISFLLEGNDESTESPARQSMASLEQSHRLSLLSRLDALDDREVQEYVRDLSNKWKEEWEFRQTASDAARLKARAKQQERYEVFLSMIRQRDGLVEEPKKSVGESYTRRDGKPGFGMPYGESRAKKIVVKRKEEVQDQPLPETETRLKSDAPNLSQMMEEKKSEIERDAKVEQKVGDTDETKTKDPATSAGDGPIVYVHSKASLDITENITDNAEGKHTPFDNLTLVQDSANIDANEDPAVKTDEAEIAAAEQRAAAAKAAQEKNDERIKQRLDAENKKKEEAKTKAEAILSRAAEEERLRMEKEQAEAEERKKEEEEAARLKAEDEAEAARMQAEVEELARLKAEEEEAAMRQAEEEERARLQAEQEDEAARLKAEEEEQARLQAEVIQQKIDDVESKMQRLTDKATGVTYSPKLDDGLYLAGVGVRKKAIINIYSVAMYVSPLVLEAVSVYPKGKQKKEAQDALRDAARTFDSSSPSTSFVLEMVFKADGKAIAGAIADSVKPRYNGPVANVQQLESLIIDGVKSKGGQATKGTVFRFDCSGEGVSVSVDGDEQGEVMCETMGSAFVDVFMDDKAVSPRLVDSCLETWCESGL